MCVIKKSDDNPCKNATFHFKTCFLTLCCSFNNRWRVITEYCFVQDSGVRFSANFFNKNIIKGGVSNSMFLCKIVSFLKKKIKELYKFNDMEKWCICLPTIFKCNEEKII